MRPSRPVRVSPALRNLIPFVATLAVAYVLAGAPAFLSAQGAQGAQGTLGTEVGPASSMHLASLATDSPAGWLARFERAYESRVIDEYAALFTTDFRFHFGDPENRAKYPNGWGLEDELLSAQHLFEGFVNDQGVSMPAARGIELSLGKTAIEPDPSRPGDARYAVIRAPAVTLAVDLGGAGYFVDRDPHTFWVVRGDAAKLSAGQAADPDHWYVWRWVESPDREWASAEPAEEPVAAR
ncbi:MAG: hypothetical protein ACREOU_05750 [Candidatus Eiseniibacteriota bacterium]